MNINKYLILDKEDNYLCLIKTKKDKIKLKELKDDIIDYNLLGFNSFISYKLYLKRDLKVDEDDYIEVVNIINIEKL